MDRARIKAVDPTGQLDDILGIGGHLGDALWKVESAGLPPLACGGLVIAGMGGSGIGGRLAVAAIGPRARRPIVVSPSYDLPPWIDASWAVLCSSYSGSTEETLAAYDAAGRAGTTRIVATTGGELADRARRDGVPVVPLTGGFQPRAAVGYSLAVALEVAAAVGAAPSLRDEIEAAAALADRLAKTWGPEGDDPTPEQLARGLEGRIPVVYGAELTAPLAYRWKCQVNENANLPAFCSELPEADHNEIEGWEAGSDQLAPLFLDDPDTHERTRTRIAITREVIGRGEVVSGEGNTRTERLVSLLLLGDLMSLHLAVQRGADPVAIQAIDRLKQRLADPPAAS